MGGEVCVCITLTNEAFPDSTSENRKMGFINIFKAVILS